METSNNKQAIPQILERILSEIDSKDLMEKLSSDTLSMSDLHTLLLYVFEKRIKNINPGDIMKNYNKNRFSKVTEANPKTLLEIDRILFKSIPAYFSAIELAPVSPLGVNCSLTSLDSKVILSTIRNLEVVADPSMALSLECAYRRKSMSGGKIQNDEVNLAASHRSLRLQNFSQNSNLSSHFRAFALASAGKDENGFNQFELSSLSSHIETWLTFLSHSIDIGYESQDISIAISDNRILKILNLPSSVDSMQDIPIIYPESETYIRGLQFTEKKLIEPLRKKYPFVHFYFDLNNSSGIGYYSGLCYKLKAKNSTGQIYSLAGGGACDWTKKLLSNKKEHLVASGFGTEVFSKFFKH